MNKGVIEKMRSLIDEARETCAAGLYTKSCRNSLLEVSAVLVELRQLIENELPKTADGAA